MTHVCVNVASRMKLSSSGSWTTGLSLHNFPLGHDDTHLVDAEGGKGSSHETRPAQDVPPVEEAIGHPLDDAQEAEAHQADHGHDLDTHRGAGLLLSHGADGGADRELQLPEAPALVLPLPLTQTIQRFSSTEWLCVHLFNTPLNAFSPEKIMSNLRQQTIHLRLV